MSVKTGIKTNPPSLDHTASCASQLGLRIGVGSRVADWLKYGWGPRPKDCWLDGGVRKAVPQQRVALEIFAGSATWSKHLQKRGWKVLAFDYDIRPTIS